MYCESVSKLSHKVDYTRSRGSHYIGIQAGNFDEIDAVHSSILRDREREQKTSRIKMRLRMGKTTGHRGQASQLQIRLWFPPQTQRRVQQLGHSLQFKQPHALRSWTRASSQRALGGPKLASVDA